MLRFYLDHREIVARRRAEFDLRKAKDRAHILEGYRIALDHLDEVIETIRKSKDPATARERLQKRFELSERQAQAILELMLQRLTNMEREKIEEEYRQIIKTIAYLEDLLSNRRKLMQVVRGELLELKEKHGDPRRTVIRAEEVGEISIEDLIAEEDVVITITRDGYIKRLPVDTYRTQGRGGKGVIALTPREQDAVEHLFISNTHQYILFFTDRGKVYRLRAHEVPPASRQARGIAVINLIRIEPGENIAAVRPIKEFTPEWHLFMATEQGVVKKTSLDAFDTRLKGGLIAINLAENDNLRWVVCTDGAQEIILATRHGMAIRFSEKEVRAMGRTAAGVRGIRLRTGDQVVGMALVEEDIEVLVATHHGYGKRTPAADYRAQSRGGIGLKTMQITPKNGPLVAVRTVRPEDEVMLITDAGQIIRQRVGDIRKTGRSTQGVRLMRLDEGDHIANLARVLVPEEEEE
jgi:DNA gyrase subunit A